jgi:hypothetical protein
MQSMNEIERRDSVNVINVFADPEQDSSRLAVDLSHEGYLLLLITDAGRALVDAELIDPELLDVRFAADAPQAA